jgi:hypothetical protein
MSDTKESLSSAIGWLLAQTMNLSFGRISIGVQLHQGRVTKITKSIEESTLASQSEHEQAGDESRR